MATTTYGVNDALAVKLWSRRLDVEALKETSFARFMGEDAGSLCRIMPDTKKGAGDRVRWGLRRLATGAGTTEGEAQEGNEESLTKFHDEMFINELGHAHRVSNGEDSIDVQRVPYDLREECYESLRDWWAERYDTIFFNVLAGYTPANTVALGGLAGLKLAGFNTITAPSTNRIVRAGNVATDELVTSGDPLLLSHIDVLVNRAKTTSPMIRPIKGLGKDLDYVLFIHEDQVTSLRTDAATAGNWFDLQKARLQGGEGDKSGLYDGAIGIYNRTLVVASTRVPNGVNSTTGAADTDVRRAIFCGASAAAWAFGKSASASKYKWTEELFDYQRELGVRASTIFGMKKSIYNSEDYGTIVLSTYAAAPTPA